MIMKTDRLDVKDSIWYSRGLFDGRGLVRARTIPLRFRGASKWRFLETTSSSKKQNTAASLHRKYSSGTEITPVYSTKAHNLADPIRYLGKLPSLCLQCGQETMILVGAPLPTYLPTYVSQARSGQVRKEGRRFLFSFNETLQVVYFVRHTRYLINLSTRFIHSFKSWRAWHETYVLSLARFLRCW